MMKTIKYLSMAALLVVGAIIMSCSTSDDMPGEDQPKSQTVTVTTTISLDNGATRALDASGHKTFEAGDKIAVPNDTVNFGRALNVLQAAGLIRLKSTAGTTPELSDIEEHKWQYRKGYERTHCCREHYFWQQNGHVYRDT